MSPKTHLYLYYPNQPPHIIPKRAQVLRAKVTLPFSQKAGQGFRYGGEELAIILEDLSHQDVTTKFNRINKSIDSYKLLVGKVTASIGFTEYL